MKNIITKGLLVLGFIFLSTNLATAQEGRIQVGPGLAFADDLGLSVDGYYGITSEIRAGAKFTYYFVEDFGGISVNFSTLDINGNYFFYQKNEIRAYGIAGLNLAFSSVGNASDSELGLNIGAGGEYAMDFGNIFAELTFSGLGGNADNIVLGAGVRFDL